MKVPGKYILWPCALFFMTTGVLHFTQTAGFERIVPACLPYPREIVYASGLLEIAGGIGLLIKRTRNWAGIGLIALLIAVFPANVNMALNTITFGLPEPLIWLRLPLQLLIIAWVFRAKNVDYI